MTRFRHDPSQSARGFVDNASALPTTPPAPQHHEKRTFDALPKADILTRHGQIARGEYQRCPPPVVRGSARHASTASSVNQTVRLQRRRRLASYAR